MQFKALLFAAIASLIINEAQGQEGNKIGLVYPDPSFENLGFYGKASKSPLTFQKKLNILGGIPEAASNQRPENIARIAQKYDEQVKALGGIDNFFASGNFANFGKGKDIEQIGSLNYANGVQIHQDGYQNLGEGINLFAEGSGNRMVGQQLLVGGNYNILVGDTSAIQGNFNRGFGSGNQFKGDLNQIYGLNNFAIGKFINIDGLENVAQGTNINIGGNDDYFKNSGDDYANPLNHLSKKLFFMSQLPQGNLDDKRV